LKITDDVPWNDHQLSTLLVSFDFTKAFDNVSDSILFNKLENHCNFFIIFSIVVFLLFTRQVSGCENQVCDFSLVTCYCWCPLGSVLRPFLFSIYINNIPVALECSSYHLHADDLAYYSAFSSNEFNNAVMRMNQDISSLVTWSKSHFLTLNSAKCGSIIVGYQQLYSQLVLDALLKVKLEVIELNCENSLRVLVVQLDNTLCWMPQVRAVTGRVFAAFHQLERLHNFLPHSLRTTLVRALIVPFIV
jgi:hypothetical protein